MNGERGTRDEPLSFFAHTSERQVIVDGKNQIQSA